MPSQKIVVLGVPHSHYFAFFPSQVLSNMRSTYFVAAALLLTTAVFAQDDEDTVETVEAGAPVIVIQKSVAETHVKVGGTIGVSVILSNEGDAPAFNVALKDGTNTKAAEQLAAGEKIEISYALPAEKIQKKTIGYATATYTGAKDDKDSLTATSNQIREEERDEKKHATEMGPRGFVAVVSADEYERLTTRHYVETFLFVVFAAVSAGFPFFVYKQKQQQVDLHLRESRKK